MEDRERDEDLVGMNSQLSEMEESINDMDRRKQLLALQVYDEDGNPVQQYYEDGSPIPMYDQEGNLYEGGGKQEKGGKTSVILDASKFIRTEGWMFKKGSGMRKTFGRKNWKRKYFSLRANQLRLTYAKNEISAPIGSISIMPPCRIVRETDLGEVDHKNKMIRDNHEQVFYIESGQRRYELFVESEEEYDDWVQTLEYIVEAVGNGIRKGNIDTGETT